MDHDGIKNEPLSTSFLDQVMDEPVEHNRYLTLKQTLEPCREYFSRWSFLDFAGSTATTVTWFLSYLMRESLAFVDRPSY